MTISVDRAGRMITFESCRGLQIRNVFSDYNCALC